MTSWHTKKTQRDRSGTIIFLILGIVGTVLVFVALTPREQPQTDSGVDESAAVESAIESPETILDAYQVELKGLVDSIAVMSEMETMFEAAEFFFTTAHVPHQLLDDHLAALIEVRRAERLETAAESVSALNQGLGRLQARVDELL